MGILEKIERVTALWRHRTAPRCNYHSGVSWFQCDMITALYFYFCGIYICTKAFKISVSFLTYSICMLYLWPRVFSELTILIRSDQGYSVTKKTLDIFHFIFILQLALSFSVRHCCTYVLLLCKNTNIIMMSMSGIHNGKCLFRPR